MPHFLTNLAGAVFRPTEAKAIIEKLRPEHLLDLEREPENPYDENAIKVFAIVMPDGEPLHRDYEKPEEAIDRIFIGYVEKLVLGGLNLGGQAETAAT